MLTYSNKSFADYTEEGNPTLRLSSVEIILLGRWEGLSNALLTLHKNQFFMVKYNDKRFERESYILLEGVVEIEVNGCRRVMEIGEVLDASSFKQTVSFYGETEAVFLLKIDAEAYEEHFLEMQMLQKEAEEIELLDGYTYHHCDRIKNYTIEVWKHLDMPGDTQSLILLRWGSYFHDIGKRAIPLEILNKPGKLTDEEWEIMKSHTTEGARMVREHAVKWLKDVAFIVEQHHERHDGTGYPYGLKGDEIALEASIVSVVDAFDAMTTDRVYKKALSIEDAVEELKAGKGTQFNPKVVDAFIEILKKKQFKWK
ncbi:HD-GYP domain-containing protein [Sporosarcina sp. YIM B06819]|uniref:HD-GYP domain-containing protein n=1 Tax=Sporosarcina sp. YIM B06819 TaxID=3081769 RepID=UPI00298C0515|nr:HD-GYP domain-containing protein [Sporosarcina sp. YIM B06819]